MIKNYFRNKTKKDLAIIISHTHVFLLCNFSFIVFFVKKILDFFLLRNNFQIVLK